MHLNSGADATWEAFRTTRIRIDLGCHIVEVSPAPTDTRGNFLDEVNGVVHVLTAWNPHGIQASATANATAGAAFAAELSAMSGVIAWPTTGIAADDSWQEDGFTVAGLTREAALALAVRWEQRAIFEWRDEPGGFRLIASDGSVAESRGWTTRIT